MTQGSLSVYEVAAKLGVSHQTIYRKLEEQGGRDGAEVLPGVPAFRIGRCWRISSAQVDQFLADPAQWLRDHQPAEVGT